MEIYHSPHYRAMITLLLFEGIFSWCNTKKKYSKVKIKSQNIWTAQSDRVILHPSRMPRWELSATGTEEQDEKNYEISSW